MDAAEWDRSYADPELLWTGEASRFLVDQVADLPARRALDLAATAVDFSPVSIDGSSATRRAASARPAAGHVGMR